MKIKSRTAKCPECGGRRIVNTGYTHNDERTLECKDCGCMFEESDA